MAEKAQLPEKVSCLNRLILELLMLSLGDKTLVSKYSV